MSDVNGAAAPEDDLRSTLESAWSDDGAAPATPAPDATPAPAKNADQPRLPDGTYTHKPPPSGDKVSTAAPAAAGTGEPPATRRAPQAWAKENQALWDKLDPAIQDVILKRETDVAKGFDERAARLKPYDELDRVFQPHRQRWQLNGWSEAQAIQQLLAAQTYLDNDPVNALRWLANSYGVRPEHLMQQPAAQQDPMVQYLAPLVQRLANVEQTLVAAHSAQQANADNAIKNEILGFAEDHPHLVMLRHDMAALLANGRAETLQEAYDKAIWMHPELRQQVLEAQAKERAAHTAEETARAKRAASSVTGAPTGSAPTGPKTTLREELEAAFG